MNTAEQPHVREAQAPFDDGDDTFSISSLDATLVEKDDIPRAQLPLSGYAGTYSIQRDKSTPGRINVVALGPEGTNTPPTIVYSLIQHGLNSWGAREEVTLHDGNLKKEEASKKENEEEEDEQSIGGINFHHWLRDRSTAIVIRTKEGETQLRNPFGTNPYTSFFELPCSKQEMKWMRASYGDTQTRLIHARRRKCVDGDDNTVAVLLTKRVSDPNSVQMTLSVMSDDLRKEDFEALLLSTVVLWMKSVKRKVTGSQVPYAGGMGPGLGMAAVGF